MNKIDTAGGNSGSRSMFRIALYALAAAAIDYCRRKVRGAKPLCKRCIPTSVLRLFLTNVNRGENILYGGYSVTAISFVAIGGFYIINRLDMGNYNSGYKTMGNSVSSAVVFFSITRAGIVSSSA